MLPVCFDVAIFSDTAKSFDLLSHHRRTAKQTFERPNLI